MPALRNRLACLASVVATALPIAVAGADPSATAPPSSGAADDVSAVFVALAEARSANDSVSVRTLVALPAKLTWKANDGQGDCTVPRSRSLADPLKAAAALAIPAPFLAALKRDKGRVRQGSACDPEGRAPFSTGEPAVTIVGDTARLTYTVSICGAGDSTHTYSLQRTAGRWQVVSLDDGCHYD